MRLAITMTGSQLAQHVRHQLAQRVLYSAFELNTALLAKVSDLKHAVSKSLTCE